MARSRRLRQKQRARGREAETPQQIPAKGLKDIAFRLKDEIAEDHVGLIAAGVAFYGLLALFPGIGAAMAIAGLVMEPQQIVAQIQSAGEVLPPEAAGIIVGQAEDVASSSGGGLGFAAALGILLSIYSASKGMGSLIEGLNIAYDEEEKRGFVKLTFTRLWLTALLVFGLLVGLSATLILPAIVGVVGLGETAELVIGLLRWPILLVLTLLGLAVLYRYAPSRDAPAWKWLTPGAGVATVLWVVGSALFAWYVANFATYNETFGALGGVIILLMWLWLSAYIVLLGGELNSEMEAQTRADTTAGAPEPMGQRGAVKADRLGEAKA